jgi:hypothetical protein
MNKLKLSKDDVNIEIKFRDVQEYSAEGWNPLFWLEVLNISSKYFN